VYSGVVTVPWGFAAAGVTTYVYTGTKVVWTWTLDAFIHTITTPVEYTMRVLDSGIVFQNGQYSFTFNSPGSYVYMDSLHQYLMGTVVVIPSLTTPAPLYGGTNVNFTPVNASDVATIQRYINILGSIDLSFLVLENFPAGLTALGSLQSLSNGVLGEIHLDALLMLSFGLTLQGNALLRTVTLSSLQHAAGDLIFDQNPLLQGVAFTNLTSLSQGLYISNSNSLTSLSAPVLTTMGANLVIISNPVLSLVSIPNLVHLNGDLVVEQNAIITSFILPQVIIIGGDLKVDSNRALQQLGLSGMDVVNGNFYICQNAPGFVVPVTVLEAAMNANSQSCVIQSGSNVCGPFESCAQALNPTTTTTTTTTILTTTTTASTLITTTTSTTTTTTISTTTTTSTSTTTTTTSTVTTTTTTATTTTASTTTTTSTTTTSSTTKTTTTTLSTTTTTSTSTTTTTTTPTTIPAGFHGSNVNVQWGNSVNGISTTIYAGDRVVWQLTLDTMPHTVTAALIVNGAPLFDSGTLLPGQSFAYIFNTPGSYFYYSNQVGLSATIVVLPQTTTTTTTTSTTTTQSGVVFVPWGLGSSGVITAVTVGSTVVWTLNVDGLPHTVSSAIINNVRLFNSGGISPGKSFNYTFTSIGTYTYSCLIHPSLAGTVVVVPIITTTATPVVLSGSASLTSPASIASFNPYTIVTGGVDFSDIAVSTFSNTQLLTITGSLGGLGSDTITAIAFSGLTYVGLSIDFESNGNLASIDMPSLASVGSSLIFFGNALSIIHLPALTWVSGGFYIASEDYLSTVSLPNLVFVSSNLVFSTNIINTISFNLLTAVGGDFTMEMNTFTYAQAPFLKTVGGNVNIDANPGLTLFNMPLLAQVQGDLYVCANANGFVVPSSVSATAHSAHSQCVLSNGAAACGAFTRC